jgi:hypothetical protein
MPLLPHMLSTTLSLSTRPGMYTERLSHDNSPVHTHTYALVFPDQIIHPGIWVPQ